MNLILVLLTAAAGYLPQQGSSNRLKPLERYEGIAVEQSSGKMVYRESHREFWSNGERVQLTSDYIGADGRILAKRTVDFSASLTLPNFRTEDQRDGYLEGGELRGDSVRLFTRKDRNAPLMEKTLYVPAPAVLDAGFNTFVQLNWDRLNRGEKLSFNFAVPFALDYHAFRLYRSGNEVVNGRRLVEITCDIDNFLLRLFVKPIILRYDPDAQRLVSYKGISNINNDEGKSYVVEIRYEPYGP